MLHLQIALVGLSPPPSTFSIAILGMFELGENSGGGTPSRGYNTNFIKDRAEQNDDNITVMLSHGNLYWHEEYKEIRYSKTAIKARLTGEKKIKRKKSSTSISVEVSINKPTVKIDLKGK